MTVVRPPDRPTTVARPTLVVARHWRPEMVDIADALRAVTDDGRREVTVVGGGRLPRVRPLLTQASAVLVSDRAPAPRRRGEGAPHVVRVWWNGSDELLAHGTRSPAAAHETHVCFFPDVAEALTSAGLDVVTVPYAFAAPRPSPADRPRRGVARFAGEVDVGPDCFVGTGPDPVRLVDRAEAHADAVVAGVTPLAVVTAAIAEDPDLSPAARTALAWSVRNRVRFRLVCLLTDELGARFELQGDDWRSSGLAAEPTNHSRRRRVRGYRTDRVSLDLGSKSTNSALYPRTAEILACGGGLVQFATGAPAPTGLDALVARQAASGNELVAMTERVLAAPEDEVALDDARLHTAYCRARLDAATLLLDAIVERLT